MSQPKRVGPRVLKVKRVKQVEKPAMPVTTTPGVRMKPGSDRLGFDESVDWPPPYIPKPYQIAGFELCGYRQPNGKVRIGFNDDAGATLLNEFPPLVEVCGVSYRLEYINENVDADGNRRNNMEWGVYC